MIINNFSNKDNDEHLSTVGRKIINAVYELDLLNIEPGKYPVEGFNFDDVFFMVMDYNTEPSSQFGAEFHQVFTDIQFIVKGEERFGWAVISDNKRMELVEKYAYDANRDICFIDESEVDLQFLDMKMGEYYAFMPNTLHMPNLNVHGTSKVRKVVIKIKTNLLIS